MKRTSDLIALFLLILGVMVCILPAQQGPTREGTETIARPKSKDAGTEAEPPKIPSKLSKKPDLPPGVPTFRTNVTAINLDVAVLDNKGQFGVRPLAWMD